MSQAQIEQFASRVSNDPAMFNKVIAGIQTSDEFIDRALATGAETGFSFTRDEASTWLNDQMKARASGELSDLQLEGVAGGKGHVTADNLDATAKIDFQDGHILPGIWTGLLAAMYRVTGDIGC